MCLGSWWARLPSHHVGALRRNARTAIATVRRRLPPPGRLPANWEFVPASSIDLADAPPSAEVVAARPRGGPSSDSLVFVVTDFPEPASRADLGEASATLARFEEEGRAWCAVHGIAPTEISRPQFLGQQTVRLDATLENPRRFLSVSIFSKDNRHQAHQPCVDAFGALMIHEPLRGPTEVLRVVHLREPRFGLTFDAPDDVWLGYGPRQYGAETTWDWVDDQQHQIELSVEPASDESLEVLLRQFAAPYWLHGDAVASSLSTLAGQPCGHLQIDPRAGSRKDRFVQRRGGLLYSLTISAPSRDPELLDRVLAGLRIGDRL